MQVQQLSDGLWRWTAPHPAWKPASGGAGGWERDVGCVYYEPRAADGTVVLIDPLAPPEGTPDARRFWRALDRDVERRGGPVVIAIGNRWHGRAAVSVRDRYRERFGAAIWVPEAATEHLEFRPDHRFAADSELPAGIEAHGVVGLEPCETAYHLPGVATLVFADAVVGPGAGELRIPPRSWAPDGEPAALRYRTLLRPSLEGLLPMAPRIVLPSHGEPVLEEATVALRSAIEAPAWGEAS